MGAGAAGGDPVRRVFPASVSVSAFTPALTAPSVRQAILVSSAWAHSPAVVTLLPILSCFAPCRACNRPAASRAAFGWPSSSSARASLSMISGSDS
ncbi:MAG: hypothetical protein NTW87_35035, partial [Planctomycetota bacterium]|nr:hypothetical protein [Planctomycetota bacterium]